jgi:hypothetical protein
MFYKTFFYARESRSEKFSISRERIHLTRDKAGGKWIQLRQRLLESGLHYHVGTLMTTIPD